MEKYLEKKELRIKLQEKLKEFRINAITGGTEAVAETIVTIENEEGIQRTASGVSEDIVTSGVEAIIEAINGLLNES